mmetsp:Transcript_27458/g.56298  ORF Transcript_27458/g.56298 Transcript_27458/m.56298 type:complete len:81 (-) Transcript_27458:512-754(-)
MWKVATFLEFAKHDTTNLATLFTAAAIFTTVIVAVDLIATNSRHLSFKGNARKSCNLCNEASGVGGRYYRVTVTMDNQDG